MTIPVTSPSRQPVRQWFVALAAREFSELSDACAWWDTESTLVASILNRVAAQRLSRAGSVSWGPIRRLGLRLVMQIVTR
jgi:hypothetical protein